MAEFYKGNIPIIDTDILHHNEVQALTHPRGASFGAVERDYSQFPQSMFASPSEMEIIPESEWDARWAESEKEQSSLEHMFLAAPGGQPMFENLNQDGFPDCWAHSTGHSIMIDRLKQGLPIIRINPVAVATLLGQTSGGWCGLSAKFAREHGYPPIGTGPGEWPYQSRKGKDTAELRENMAKFKIVEDWVDLTQQVYSQNLTRAQLSTCLWNNIPCPVDFNWWSHSICAIRWVKLEAGGWGLLILNSWGPGWGRLGLSVLKGSQMIPNGAMATRMSVASVGVPKSIA